MLNSGSFCCIVVVLVLIVECGIMEINIPVLLNNRDPRMIRVEQNIAGDNKLQLRHSDKFLNITNKYSYTIERAQAIELARKILDFYDIDHQ